MAILTFSQLISNMGWWLTTLALNSFVLYYKEFDTISYGLMMFFNALPILIFGYLGGKISDRLNKKKTIMVTEILRGIIVAMIPLSKNIYTIWILVFLNTTLFTVFRGALFGITKELFEEEYVMKANSIFVTCRNIGMISGPMILSLLLINKNWALPFYLDTLTYMLSALALFFIQYEKHDYIDKIHNSEKSFIEIVTVIKENKNVNKIFYYTIAYSIIAGLYNTGWFIFVKDSLKAPAEYIGIFQLFIGSGSIIGAIIINKLNTKFNKRGINYCSMIIYIISIFILSFSHSIYITQIVIFILGIGFSIFTISMGTIIQLEVEQQFIGRVSSIFHTIQLGIQLIWSSIIGILAMAVTIDNLFKYVSIIIFFVVIIFRKIFSSFARECVKCNYSD
ncbi:MFS transporter [Tepidibacter thalassicus]|uniref:Major Facilitator Superfamily protein n=1 Tax=Tepidibacter thalassicus DSM 15285 TaxID=1123350 RepID=A0A1M5SYN4_9FIRM|nr:MFS transporter [Tepidibacter thalassicus]SHH43470.1 Major Facilitator Superfamily protein [Tepidibacter thalassicus DSM 15285]